MSVTKNKEVKSAQELKIREEESRKSIQSSEEAMKELEKMDFDFELITKETLKERSTPIPAASLNAHKAKVGKKSWKPWKKPVTAKKVILPPPPQKKETLSEDDFVIFEDPLKMDQEVKEAEELHQDTKKLMEVTDKALSEEKLSEDDFEILELEDGDELQVVKDSNEDDDIEILDEEEIEEHQEDESFMDEFEQMEIDRTSVKEVQDDLKKAEFELDADAQVKKLSAQLAKIRFDKSVSKEEIAKLEAKVVEAIDTRNRLRHRREAEEAVATLSQNVIERDTHRLTQEESRGSDSDLASTEKKTRIASLTNSLLESWDTPNEKEKEALEILKQYATSSFYTIGHKAEANLMKQALNAVKVLEENVSHDGDQDLLLEEIRESLESTANGELDVDLETVEKEQIKDFRGQQPEEKLKNASFFTKLRQNVLYSSVFCKWEDRKEEPLFAHEPTINDLRQGKVSNCYMVAAVTSLIHLDPGFIKKMMRDNGDGSVTVRLYQNGKPKYVVVDKISPRLRTGGAIMTDGPLWMNVLERAFAFMGRKGNKGYGSLWYGSAGEVFSVLTGASVLDDQKDIKIGAGQATKKTETKTFDEDEKTKIFMEICSMKQLGRVYGCGTYNDAGSGVNSGHAYTILGGRTVNGERYIHLRNPYANMSLQYNEKGDRSKSTTYVSSVADATSGQFLMKLDDFLNEFTGISYFTLKKPVTDE